MRKKILCLLLVLCSIFLCGCSVPTQYTLSQNSDGSVEQIIYIPFSGTELSKLGMEMGSITQISNLIKTQMNNYFGNLYTNMITKLAGDSGLSDQDKLLIINGCPTQSQLVGVGDYSGIEYDLKFSNSICYYYYNLSYTYNELIEELKKDTSIVQESFFTDKVINRGTAFFGQKVDNGDETLAEYIYNSSKTILKNNSTLTDEQIETVVPKEFLYRYGTPSSKMHSDCDLTKEVSGVFYHEWNFNVTEYFKLKNASLQDQEKMDEFWEIETYTYKVNKNVWYSLILIIAMLLLGILIVVYYIKNKKEKSNIEVVQIDKN